MDINTALQAFESLSQETRLNVVRLLVHAGPAGLPAGEIAAQLDCRQNTMSTNLKLLNNAGLISKRRVGRSIIYSANFATVRKLVVFLLEDCCAGDAAVCQSVAESLEAPGNTCERGTK